MLACPYVALVRQEGFQVLDPPYRAAVAVEHGVAVGAHRAQVVNRVNLVVVANGCEVGSERKSSGNRSHTGRERRSGPLISWTRTVKR